MSEPGRAGPLAHLRICDFTGQLAGAGATKFLAAFGAQVIRIEDPVTEGRWDILRGGSPYIDERRGVNLGGSFNNHNVEKLGITLNLRTSQGRDLLRRLVAISDVVSENFSAGVLERWGFGYDTLKAIKPDIIYAFTCGFGHSGPYRDYKTWGPIVQAVSGLTFSSGLRGREPAGWGYSYMDHTGAYYLAMAILLAVHHRHRTGEGQAIDCSAVEAAIPLNGPALLDYTVNGRPLRRPGSPDSNRSQFPRMAPHGIYPAAGDDAWVAIACRDDAAWSRLAAIIGAAWATAGGYATLDGRLADEDALDAQIAGWTRPQDPFDVQRRLQGARIPAAAVQKPQQRVDMDPNTAAWALWPGVRHGEMGDVRVDGLPVHLSKTDWRIERASPCLGQDNDHVYREILGLDTREIESLRAEGVI